MAKKTRKCQWCNLDDTLMEDMKFEVVGEKRPIKKFYHKHCHELFLERQAFLDKEAKELDELRLVIEEIYGVQKQGLSKEAYSLLQKLRNGEPVFKKQNTGKRYKQGFTYPLIKETFEHCSDSIEYYNRVKNFTGFMNAFRYALTVIIDKIYVIELRAIEREKQKIQMEKHIEKMDVEEQVFETNYKKPSKAKDITDFLDD